jgi:hypothetical protein
MVKFKAFTLNEANEMVANAPTSTWSDGVAPPGLHKFTLKGAQNGKPKKSGKLRYKAADMRKLAVARYVPRIHMHAMHRIYMHMRIRASHPHVHTRLASACACTPRIRASHAHAHAYLASACAYMSRIRMCMHASLASACAYVPRIRMCIRASHAHAHAHDTRHAFLPHGCMPRILMHAWNITFLASHINLAV